MQKIYNFKRKVILPDMTAGDPATNPVFARYRFALADVPGSTDFTNMFDKFRIKYVKISFIPKSNVTVPSGTLGTRSIYDTLIYTAVDTDFVTVPSSIADILQRQNVKWSPNNVVHKRFFRPRYPVTSVIVDAKQWMRTDSTGPNNLWSGLQVAVEGESSRSDPGAVLYQVVATYYIQCKNPK